MAGSNHDRDIGVLLERTERLLESNEKAEAARKAIYESQDEIKTRLARVEEMQESHSTEMADVKKVTEDVKRWRLMGLGALGVVGLGGTALGASIVAALEPIARLFGKH